MGGRKFGRLGWTTLGNGRSGVPYVELVVEICSVVSLGGCCDVVGVWGWGKNSGFRGFPCLLSCNHVLSEWSSGRFECKIVYVVALNQP